jgi:hypothetical protein
MQDHFIAQALDIDGFLRPPPPAKRARRILPCQGNGQNQTLLYQSRPPFGAQRRIHWFVSLSMYPNESASASPRRPNARIIPAASASFDFLLPALQQRPRYPRRKGEIIALHRDRIVAALVISWWQNK